MARTRRTASRVAPARGSPQRPSEHAGDRITALLAGLGMLLTAYLTLTAWTDATPLLCGEGGGCELIQQSRWSRLLGLPVAAWGFATYAVLLCLALLPMSRLRRWQRVWTVSLIGLAISVYLTAAGLLALQSLCGWCLVSLALIAAVFVRIGLRRPPSAPGTGWGNWLLGSTLTVGVVLLALHLYWSDVFRPRADPHLEALAAHLDATGARFYGASWCPACREQKELFGAAAEQLPYVECSPQGRRGPSALECTTAGIRNFPTWVIRGRTYEQIMSPEELARRSGFRGLPARE